MQDVGLYPMSKRALVEEIFRVNMGHYTAMMAMMAMAATTSMSEKRPPGCRSGPPLEKWDNFAPWRSVLDLRKALESWTTETPMRVVTSISGLLSRTWWSRKVAERHVLLVDYIISRSGEFSAVTNQNPRLRDVMGSRDQSAFG